MLRLLEDFEDFFDGTMGDWDTELINLELKPDYKPFDCKFNPLPRINKETFGKEVKTLRENRSINSGTT